MQNVDLRKMILAVLRKNYDKDLDATADRKALATALDEMFNHALNECLCMSCAHLDEVHMINSCLGGPDTNCDCLGFKNYEP